MSLTSYRAAPPRVMGDVCVCVVDLCWVFVQRFGVLNARAALLGRCLLCCVRDAPFLAGLAATYSPRS